MTNGTSQGLFIVVAIVIFGVFVALSYTVFGSDGLSGGLSNLFSNASEKTEQYVLYRGKVPVSDEHFVFETFTNPDTGNTEVRIVDYIGNDNGVSSDIVIPSSLGGYPVTTIGNMAFRRKGLTSVTLPDSLVRIDDGYTSSSLEPSKTGAFMGNRLTEITLPESIEYVGVRAFYSNRLHTVNFPESEFLLRHTVFASNRLTEFELPNYITTIPRYTLYSNSMVEYVVQPHITSIGDRAFEESSRLKILTIPDNVISISERMLHGASSLHTVNLPLRFEELVNDNPAVLAIDRNTLEQPATINYTDSNGNIVKTVTN